MEKSKDIILDDFKNEALFKNMILPIITVYENTVDYPVIWVARLFDTDKPTSFIVFGNSFTDIQFKIPCNMVLFNPSKDDDKNIRGIFL